MKADLFDDLLKSIVQAGTIINEIRQQESEGVVGGTARDAEMFNRGSQARLAAMESEGVVVEINDNLPGMGAGPDCVSMFAVDGSQPFLHGQRWLVARIPNES